jgi:hypothetical protein
MTPLKKCINLVKGIRQEGFNYFRHDKSLYKHCKKISADGRFLKILKFKAEAVVLMDYNNDWYICFQGSWKLSDWLMNLFFQAFPIKPYKDMPVDSKIRVHFGFISQYKVIRPHLRSKLKSFASTYGKPNNVYFTGHSLGGALAAICALDSQFHKFLTKDRIHMISFGSPRVGNKDFVDSYNERVTNSDVYINGNDIVPMLPFGFMGYNPLSEIKYIKEKSFPYISVAAHNNKHYVKYFTSDSKQ